MMTFESLGKEKGLGESVADARRRVQQLGRLNCTDVNRRSEFLSCRSPSIATQPGFRFRSLRICEAGMRRYHLGRCGSSTRCIPRNPPRFRQGVPGHSGRDLLTGQYFIRTKPHGHSPLRKIG
jgi:hypothetical protein